MTKQQDNPEPSHTNIGLDEPELNDLGTEEQQEDELGQQRNKPDTTLPLTPEICNVECEGIIIQLGSMVLRADTLAALGMQMYRDLKANGTHKKQSGYIG